MSKSLNNFYTIDDVEKQGIDPMTLRLLFAQTHYRQQMNFTWESAKAAQEALNKLRENVIELKNQTQRSSLSDEKLGRIDDYRKKFSDAITNDLQVPQAVAVMWELLKSNVPSQDKLDLLFEFDQILGLRISEIKEEKIPDEIVKFANEREQARKAGDFNKSDELRKKIQQRGYTIEDLESGYKIKKV